MVSHSIDQNRELSISSSGRVGFVVTLIYLCFEYGRPQDLIPGLGALRLGLILMATLILLLLVNNHRLRMVASPQTSRVLLLLLLMALYIPFAVNNGRAYLVTKGLFMQLVVFASILTFVDTFDRYRILMRCWILLMGYIAVNGILGSGAAGSSFLADENDFALLMNMMLPFSIFLSFYEKNKKTKLLYTASALVCLASIIASFSRGGFLGLAIVALAVWLATPRKVLTLFVGIFCVIVLLNAPIRHSGTLVKGSTYWQEMASIFGESGKDYNRDSRLELWKAGWYMFLDHPFGVGPGNYSVRLPEYQSDYFGARNMWGKAAHSLLVMLLTELGIPGLLLYVSLLMANVRDIRYLKSLQLDSNDVHRFAHFLSLAFSTSVVGFFASGMFVSVLYYPHYWYLTAMIVAGRKIIDRNLGRDEQA